MRQKEKGRSEGETRATIVNYTTMCNKTWPKGLGGAWGGTFYSWI